MSYFNQPNQNVDNQYNAGHNINISKNQHHHPLYVPPRPSPIIPGLIAIIFFIGIIGFGAYLVLNTNILKAYVDTHGISSNPKDTLSGFCGDLGSNRKQDAYDKYSSRLKAQVSPADFTAQWGNKLGVGCVVSITNSSDQQAQGTIVMTPFDSNQQTDYQVTLIIEDNAWKIDSINQQ